MSAPAHQGTAPGYDRATRYWIGKAQIRQRIIEKQDKTIADLTASVVQLENDYDLVEAEVKQLHAQLTTSRPW